jgi:hypothetical protein
VRLWGAGGLGDAFGWFLKRVRGGWAKSQPRHSPERPGRVKPRGGSGEGLAKHLPCHKGLSEGSKPRNRGPSGRPGASAAGIPLGETVGGRISGGNAGDTFREEKPPKGESHERCRYETRLARVRREQTAKRVVKP